MSKSRYFSTCQHLKANLFACFATYRLFYDILLGLFSPFDDIVKCTHEMFGTPCVVHTFVCIYVNMFTNILKKKHVNMLVYEVNLFKFKTYQVYFICSLWRPNWGYGCTIFWSAIHPNKNLLSMILDDDRQRHPYSMGLFTYKSVDRNPYAKKSFLAEFGLYRKDPLVCRLPAQRLIHHCLFIFVYSERT
jgi:hypothetical protein